MMIRATRAPTFFMSLALGTTNVHSSTKMPMTKRADQRAERVAEPAEGDRREHQQQQREAHVPADAVLEAVHHAAEAGEGAAEDPHDEDHAVGVDAARRRQLGIVGDGPDRLAEPGPEQEEGDADDH